MNGTVPVVAMFGGALIGAELVMHGQAGAALGIATLVLLTVAALAARAFRTHPHNS